MPRKSRKNLQGNFFHIVTQGLNKQYIFNEEKYRKKYRTIMFDKLQRVNVTILAYCIMNNHSHILIYCENIDMISKYMQLLNTTYSNFFNREEKRVGYVFKDRFFSQEILDSRHLYSCLKYIHDNPIKASICKKAYEYPYSSYNEFIRKKYIITDKSINILFGNSDNYISYFNNIHDKLYEDLEIFDIKELNIYDIIKNFEIENKIQIQDLKKNKELLKKVIKDARKMTDVTLNELAKILGISKSTVGNYAKN